MASAVDATLSYLLTEKDVDIGFQQKLQDVGITSVRLFAIMAEDRKELREILNDAPIRPQDVGRRGPGPG